MSRLAHIVLLLAFLCSANLHLPVLQVAAWTGMLVTYSQQTSFREAVEMTFDGDHPCSMCEVIREQETSDASVKQWVPLHRLVVFLELPMRWIQSLYSYGALESATPSLLSFWPLPELPPPRSFV
ncbi:MAG: hypothetical protein M9963_01965 [Kiritimatiellae bacterium]|nr:hypothetical protein [Kiritimatiellia bacterium]